MEVIETYLKRTQNMIKLLLQELIFSTKKKTKATASMKEHVHE